MERINWYGQMTTPSKVITISMRNVHSEIVGDFDAKKLDRFLSVFYEGYTFSPLYRTGQWDGKQHFFSIAKNRFPTGLLKFVEEFLKEAGLVYQIVDLRQRPTNEIGDYKLHGIKLRDYQLEAVDTAIGYTRGILELCTGSGKTEVACAIAKALNVRTLFLVNSKDLLYQAQERFQQRTGRAVGIIGDSKWDADHQIVISTVQSISSKMKTNLEEMKTFLLQFNLLFMDECHHSSSSQFFQVGMFCHNAYYRFGLSGTALRRDVLSNAKAIAVLGDVIAKVDSSELIEKKILSNLKVLMVQNPEKITTGYYQELYQKAIVDSFVRNSLVADIVEREWKEKKRILILVTRIEHGENILLQLTRKKIPTVFLSGKDDSQLRELTKKEFNDKGNTVLLSTVIFDEGVDLPQINVLVLAGGGKSEVRTIQRVGRGLRKKADGSALVVYDFFDQSKYLKAHSKKRQSVYEEQKFEVENFNEGERVI